MGIAIQLISVLFPNSPMRWKFSGLLCKYPSSKESGVELCHAVDARSEGHFQLLISMLGQWISKDLQSWKADFETCHCHSQLDLEVFHDLSTDQQRNLALETPQSSMNSLLDPCWIPADLPQAGAKTSMGYHGITLDAWCLWYFPTLSYTPNIT